MDYKFILGDRIDGMRQLDAESVDLIITSPPYNVGKNYSENSDFLPLDDYFAFLSDTWRECQRALKVGGRLAINVATITHHGEWVPLNSHVIQQCLNLGYLMRTDYVWNKHQVSNRTAWGSWQSPSDPRCAHPYEYILVFSKDTKVHKGNKDDIDITRDEFLDWTLALWDIAPETRRSKDHPAPFPEKLVERLIKFYTYKGDVVMDPFGGSGTVVAVSKRLGRHGVYIDNSESYLNYAKRRCESVTPAMHLV